MRGKADKKRVVPVMTISWGRTKRTFARRPRRGKCWSGQTRERNGMETIKREQMSTFIFQFTVSSFLNKPLRVEFQQ